MKFDLKINGMPIYTFNVTPYWGTHYGYMSRGGGGTPQSKCTIRHLGPVVLPEDTDLTATIFGRSFEVTARELPSVGRGSFGEIQYGWTLAAEDFPFTRDEWSLEMLIAAGEEMEAQRKLQPA